MQAITTTKLLRWGNSYGLRLTKRDVERLGLHEGSQVDVSLLEKQDRIEAPHYTFAGGRDGSRNHDEVLYGWRWRE